MFHFPRTTQHCPPIDLLTPPGRSGARRGHALPHSALAPPYAGRDRFSVVHTGVQLPERMRAAAAMPFIDRAIPYSAARPSTRR